MKTRKMIFIAGFLAIVVFTGFSKEAFSMVEKRTYVGNEDTTNYNDVNTEMVTLEEQKDRIENTDILVTNDAINEKEGDTELETNNKIDATNQISPERLVQEIENRKLEEKNEIENSVNLNTKDTAGINVETKETGRPIHYNIDTSHIPMNWQYKMKE